jgi:hypothetical protein
MREATETRTDLLVGLAMLRQDWDRKQKSFLDNFEPFVADCLRRQRGGGVSEAQLATCVREQFGIVIPVRVVTTLVRRMSRQGAADRRDKLVFATASTRDREPLDAERTAGERKVNALVSRLADYARDEAGLDWSAERAEQALRLFVEDWSSSLSLMRAELAGGAYAPRLFLDHEAGFVVAKYVLELRRREPEVFGWFMDVIKSSMLSAGLYLDPGRLNQSMAGITLYFDTPFLLDFLVGDDDLQLAAREVVELATELGLVPACFEHTVSEMRSVLEGHAQALRGPHAGARPGPSSRDFPKTFGASDLEELAEELPARLTAVGIAVKRKPLWDGTPTTDEAALSAELQATIGYRSDNTRQRDVESLVAVHRIRRGSEPSEVERARAYFVTTNTDLVRASARHFGTAGQAHAVPVAMSDHELATLLWLKSPTPRPDLPWRHVIADCRAALNPSDALWCQYLDELEKLEAEGDVQPERYFLARYSTEARRALVDRTHGDPSQVDSRTVAEILDEALRAVSQPDRERANTAELQAREVEALRRQSEAQRIADQEAAGHELARATARALQEGKVAGARDTAREFAQLGAKAVGAAVALAVLLVFVFGEPLKSLPGPQWLRRTLSVVVPAVSVVFAGLTSFGGSVNSWVASRLQPRFEAWFVKRAMKPAVESDS